ncbi:hypothetical protein TL16_g05389 [Triparma laevis f. inornata]|uniref:Uncharacterized protein n=2 Tax=Triparma laevis TaxID=1534972 RepID=A0A9W7CF46_9STRA|nr:hypothetical protein TL16_g05389 [Triparma laevis f. inornata]GMI07152.1 hypothetical protein TrLO_g11033 [Triparma laevis f. longispina]
MARRPIDETSHTDPGFVAMIVAGLFVLGFFLTVCGCQPSPRSYLTQEELDDARLRRESTKEGRIKQQMKRLEKRLRGSRMRKAAINSAQETERLLEKRKDEWDVKGKAVYGEAWEESVDGNMPMKDLFSLPPDELREIKIEAHNKALLANQETEEIERVERETQRYNDNMAMNTARMKASQMQNYYDSGAKNPMLDENFGIDPSKAFLDNRRKHKPVETAPFHDPRFVSRGSTFRGGGGGAGGEVGGVTPDPRFVSFPQPPPQGSQPVQRSSQQSVLVQAPGLAKPAPPPIPPAVPYDPTPMGMTDSHVIDMQAPGLAKPKPPRVESPKVEMQAPGLAKPKPPSLPPPPSNVYGGLSEGEEVVKVVVKKKSSENKSSLSSFFDTMNKKGSGGLVAVNEAPRVEEV